MFDNPLKTVAIAVGTVVLAAGSYLAGGTATESPKGPASPIADTIDVAKFCADSNTHVVQAPAGSVTGKAYELGNSVTKQYVYYKYTSVNGVANDLADYVPYPGADIVPAQRVTADALNCIIKKGGR